MSDAAHVRAPGGQLRRVSRWPSSPGSPSASSPARSRSPDAHAATTCTKHTEARRQARQDVTGSARRSCGSALLDLPGSRRTGAAAHAGTRAPTAPAPTPGAAAAARTGSERARRRRRRRGRTTTASTHPHRPCRPGKLTVQLINEGEDPHDDGRSSGSARGEAGRRSRRNPADTARKRSDTEDGRSAAGHATGCGARSTTMPKKAWNRPHGRIATRSPASRGVWGG